MRPPIPRALLAHSALLQSETTDAWQRPVVTERHELHRIRIEADFSRQADEQDTVHRAHWLLVYDCRHSRPRSLHFRPGQVILWQEKRLTITRVTPVWADQQLHHYEVELTGG